MIILSDCLQEKTDEGCIKVASTLARRLQQEGAKVYSINKKCDYADDCLHTNKLLFSFSVFKTLSHTKEEVLYIPFASNTLGSVLRLCILKMISRRRINVIFTLCWNMNKLTKLLLRVSKANIIVLSKDAYASYNNNKNIVNIIKTGVDTTRFYPVYTEEKVRLRSKYNIPVDKKVILHVGHLKSGRNIEEFLKVKDAYQVILVFSSVTEKDKYIKSELEKRSNILMFDEYIEDISELYKLADIYVFPTVAVNNSIDIPLSVLEAAACNLRILATPYKELKYFRRAKGFIYIDNEKTINDYIKQVLLINEVNTRIIAQEYDWNSSIINIKKIII